MRRFARESATKNVQISSSSGLKCAPSSRPTNTTISYSRVRREVEVGDGEPAAHVLLRAEALLEDAGPRRELLDARLHDALEGALPDRGAEVAPLPRGPAIALAPPPGRRRRKITPPRLGRDVRE